MTCSRRRLFKGIGYGSLLFGAYPVATAKAANLVSFSFSAGFESAPWFPDGEPVALWGYDVPVIELTQYGTSKLEFTNQLDIPTTVHWHGMAVTNDMDGVSGLTQAPVAPSESFVYELTPKDAGTYWAHAHHNTYRQLAMGLYVPIIVHEATPYPVDQDILFVADDWRMAHDGQLDIDSFDNTHDWSHGGRLGNVLTINRQRQPSLNVIAGQRIRLRLLNAANSRILRFAFADVPVQVVAKDGQPLVAPKLVKEPLIVAPAERFDVIIDIPAHWHGLFPIYEASAEQPYLAAQWQVVPSEERQREVAPVMPLPANPMPTVPDKADHRLTLTLEGGAMGNLQPAYYQGKKLSVDELIRKRQFWTQNGQAGFPEEPLLRVRVGDVVEIELKNDTMWGHAMHLHGHHFRAAHHQLGETLWQDTVLVYARDTLTLRFVATETGQWLLHCHMIEHQVSGMVTYLEVVA